MAYGAPDCWQLRPPRLWAVKTKIRLRSCSWEVITVRYCNGIKSAPIADNSDLPIVGGQNQDMYLKLITVSTVRHLNGILSAPIADSSDRPDCGRSRPRQVHGQVLLLDIWTVYGAPRLLTTPTAPIVGGQDQDKVKFK